MLGFGTVRKYGNIYRYIVTDQTNIFLLTSLFNGNLVLNHRQSQLTKWILALPSYPYGSIQAPRRESNSLTVNSTLIKPSLKDAWLSGFTDAEGCFNVNIKKRVKTVTGFRVSLRFTLDQKNAQSTLINIRDVFGYGQVNLRKETNNVFRYSNDSFKGLNLVLNYFLIYPLKTKKSLSFTN